MTKILDRLIAQHEELEAKADLALSSKEYSPEFGGSACLKYTNGMLSVMVTKGRDGICYYIGNGDLQEDNWYSVDIVWNYLQDNHDYRRMKVSSPFSFIKENMDSLKRMFDSEERCKTETQLNRLEKIRSKKLFG